MVLANRVGRGCSEKSVFTNNQGLFECLTDLHEVLQRHLTASMLEAQEVPSTQRIGSLSRLCYVCR